MNKKLKEILSSQQLKSFFDCIYLQPQMSRNAFIFNDCAMREQKRLSANVLDIFNFTDQTPSQTIDQSVTTFKEYCEQIFEKEYPDNISFLKDLKSRLKNELFRGLFTKSNNSEVLQNYKIDSAGLKEFRENVLLIAGFLEPNKEKIGDQLIVLMLKDNLERFKTYVSTCTDTDLSEMYDRYMSVYNGFIKNIPPDDLTEDLKQTYEILTKVKFVENYMNLPTIYQANDNLPYRKIRRNVNINFSKSHFDTLKLLTNLIQSYELGFVEDEIMFNGEYFYNHQDGSRIITSSNPITLQNIHTIGRFNQCGFILPENLVYGFQNSILSNEFSFTLSQENVTGGEQYKGFGYPLTYGTKNGFFCEKKCEYAKTVTGLNTLNQPTQYTYYYYTSIENDTSEKYVKVVEQNLQNQQISVALYAFPLDHVNAGIQICRVDSNDPSFMVHNIGGKEGIQTIFHMHKYNIIDQVRSEGDGEFDIMLKLDDNLTQAQALELFDGVCKTYNQPEQMFDENNNPINFTPNQSAKKFSAAEIANLQQQAITYPFDYFLSSFYGEDEVEDVIENATQQTPSTQTIKQQESVLSQMLSCQPTLPTQDK